MNNNYIKISSLSTIILIISSCYVFGQILDQEQNPPHIKFNKIQTQQFSIIYPQALEQDAQRVANTLQTVIGDVSKSLGKLPHPISIVLQNQGVVSNAFVTMAPRRSEFYTMPGQEFDMQDWLNSLCVHELRHVVQFDKVGGKLGNPFFEQLKLALFGINLPPWYFEGDAVGIETILSKAGRGRQPLFNMALRTNLLSNQKFSYSKNYFGSVKDVTPGYYPLGYFMVTKMRRDFGENILDKTLSRIAALPIRPYNFSNSLKKFTGINTKQLYLNTMIEIDSLWKQQASYTKFEKYEHLNNLEKQNPSDYLLPYFINDSNWVCLKSSKASLPTITLITANKQEKKLLRIGYQTEPNLHYANNVLVWDEYRTDARFLQRSYNVINTYNLESHQYKQLTHRSRLFSPALSANGKTIAAIKVSTNNQFNVVEIDAINGKELTEYPNPDNYTLQTPQYNEDSNRIVVTAVNAQGKTILLYNKNDKKIKILIPFERQLISRPLFYKNNIIFKAHYNGIDNLYRLNLDSNKTIQISHAEFGAFNASVYKNQLLFNDYQYQGYAVSKIDLNNVSNAAQEIEDHFVPYFEPLQKQENPHLAIDSISKNQYPVKPYKELNHLFYFHSLSPVIKNINADNASFGLNLLSANLLGTTTASIGYLYRQDLQESQFNASFTYAKFYPKFTVTYENRPKLGYINYISQNSKQTVAFTYRENFTKLSANLPFNKNWMNKNLWMNLELSTAYTQRYNFTEKPRKFADKIAFPLRYAYNINLNDRRSPRDLAPRFGQNMSIEFSHLPFNNEKGTFLSLNSQFYFPGIFANHSLQASINYQHSDGAYRLNNDISRASGYAHLKPLASLSNSLLLDYRFPICYPDWEIGPLAYVKRIKGGVFTDFENIENEGLRSYGIELRADMNLLRYYLPNFDVGAKLIFDANKNYKKPIFEFMLNYNL